MKPLSILLSLMIIFFIIGACQKQTDTEKPSEIQAVQKAEINKLEIIDPWIRPASAGTNTAFFFKVVNNTENNDTLYGAASDLARKVEVHETYMAENDMMGMRHIDFVVIPKGDTVVFKPRDLHVMLMKLNNDLMAGDSGKVTLNFKNVGEVIKTGVVRDMPKM